MPAYIKLPDIEGEVEEQNHVGWIEVQSVSLPIFRSITEGAKGAQRRSGETSLGDFNVVKEWDSSSPKLAQAVAEGTHMDEVLVHLCGTINNLVVVNMEYKLANVVPTGYSFMGTNTQKPVPTEQISFNYTAVEMTYKKFDTMGADAGNFPAKYDTEKATS